MTAADPEGPSIGRILVPLDLEPFSLSALHVAQRVAVGAELHALHVLPGVANAAPAVLHGHVDDAARCEWAREELARQLAEAHLPVPTLTVRIGAPAREICRYAEEARVDLIVIPSHARRRLQRLLIGSVAEAVVRRAPCPVLVVRGRLPAGWAPEPPT